jgi:hypothetical protein
VQSSIPEVIGRGLAVAAVTYVLQVLPQFAPSAAIPPPAGYHSIAELDARFATTKNRINASMLVVAIVIFISLHSVLLLLQRWFASSAAESVYVFLPSNTIWYFLPGFAAVCLCWETVLLVWSHVGGAQQAALYRYWSDLRAGYNATRALRVFAWTVVLPIGIATFLALPMHTTFQEERIEIHGYARVGAKYYSYADVQRVSLVDGELLRDGTFQFDPQVVVDLKGGRRWSTRDSRDPQRSVDLVFMNFVAAKARVTPVKFHSKNDIH